MLTGVVVNHRAPVVAVLAIGSVMSFIRLGYYVGRRDLENLEIAFSLVYGILTIFAIIVACCP
jgi:hypothetical protein